MGEIKFVLLVATIILVGMFSINSVSGTDFIEVRGNVATGPTTWEPTDFSGFYYDLDEGIGSEELSITQIDARTISEANLVYRTSIQQVDYAADFYRESGNNDPSTSESYPVISLFGEKYVPLSDTSPDELVKLLVENDDKYTLRTGSTLKLPNGYELTSKQIDTEGYKVWLELSKNGEFIEDEVINVFGGPATWTYKTDVGTTDDVIVFRVSITDVFRGQIDSVAIIGGLYLVEYQDVLTIESGDEFGELEVASITEGTITMESKSGIALNKNSTIDITEGLKLKVADSDQLRFYLMKEYIEPGIYEIRGTVANGTETWTPANFAGFCYNINDDIGSEELTLASLGGRTIPGSYLVYTTTIQQKKYAANFGDDQSYPIIGLFGEEYVSLSDNSADQLVKLLVDNDEKYTLRTGSTIELPNGYELTAKQIDAGNDQVQMELSRNGEFIEESIINLANDGTTWTYKQDVGNTSDVTIFKVLLTDISVDSDGSLVTVEGTYLIDYQNIISIEFGKEFEQLQVDSISDATIRMSNIDSIDLTRDEIIDIAPGIKFKVADDEALRYYPFVEKKLEENPLYLEIDSFGPSTDISSYEGSSQTFGLNINKPANVTWFLDGEQVQKDSSVNTASCTLSIPNFGDYAIKAVASNEKYSVAKEWKWTVKKSPEAVDKIYFRSPIYDDSSSIRIDPLNFSGFYYDLDEGIGSEELSIKQITSRIIPEGGLVYSTSIQQNEYAADFYTEPGDINPSTSESYPVIGFFGEKYVPLSDTSPDELVKLLVDNDDKYTLQTGSTIELPNGYELTAKQIDVEGDKVWMELSKDGEIIEDEVISVVGGPATWTYKLDVATTYDVIVFRVLITDLFQGQVDSLAVVEGLYLIDYENVLSIDSGDEFGELEVTGFENNSILMDNGDSSITLIRDSTIDIAEGFKLEVADSDQLRFYLTKEAIEPGIYEIRGDIATGPQIWTPTNFGGLFYNLERGTDPEELLITDVSGKTIPEGSLTYKSTIQQVDYNADFAIEEVIYNRYTYPLIAFFGDEYVSLSDTNPAGLVELLLDSSDNHTLRDGSILELPNGYNLTARQIDVVNSQAQIELSRNGELIEQDTIDLTSGETTWTYKTDLGNASDVIVFRALVTDISTDSHGSLVKVGGLYLVDFQNVLSIQIDDEFVELEVTSISDDTIRMSNMDSIYLKSGEVIEIVPGIMFKVADDEELTYYPFVKKQIKDNPLYLEIESFSPSNDISSYESSSQRFTLDINKPANFAWFLDGEQVQTNSSVNNSSFTLSIPSFGEYAIKAVASNEKYSVVKEWKWTVQKDLTVTDKVEFRSPVYEGSSTITISPLDFAGFYYDLDKGIGSEELSIKQITSRTIPEGNLIYRTSIQQMDYGADFASEYGNSDSSTSESYPVIGLFGEKYVPLSDNSADELVKLLLDNDDKYLLRTGSVLELPDGYELTAKQIDVEGDKIWMELSKDGEFIEDEVISVVGGPATWTYKKDVGTTDDVIVFRIHITDVFKGLVDSIAVVEGTYLLDYEDVISIEAGDQFGELEVNEIAGSTITMDSTRGIDLNKNSIVNITEDFKLKVADSDQLRFYLMKEYIEPGTYELKGSVAGGTETWTPVNFAGFFYDIDDNIGSEELVADPIISTRTIHERDLVYKTSIQQKEYTANFHDDISYPIIGLFGEKYVALSDNSADKLVKLLVDNEDEYTLRADSTLDLPNGYGLTATTIDVGNNRAHIEFSRNGELIEQNIIDLASGETTWTYNTNLGGTDNVEVLKVLITDISLDSQGSMVTVGGLYLVDFHNVLSIQIDDEFVEFEVNSISNGTIQMSNMDSIHLTSKNIIEIAPGIMFKIADDEALRYYPFVEKQIDENPLYLEIDSFSPSTEVSSYEGSSQKFTLNVNKPANFTWFLDGEQVQDNLAVSNSSYTLSASSFGEYTIKAVATNEQYSVAKEWRWTVQKSPGVVDKVEFRSPVYDDSSSIKIDPLDFAGFYYDFDQGTGSEELIITQINARNISEDDLIYRTAVQQINYAADFASEPGNSNPNTSESYPVIGLFGEKYISLDDNTPDELVKLLVDSDDKYTLQTGSTIKLPEGYELTARQVDIQGDKVWMELSKDGEFIEDEVISLVVGTATWTYKTDVGATDDVIVFRLHITDIFQGEFETFAVVEGIYLLNYEDVFSIESGDVFGELEIDTISDAIIMSNTGTITLSRGDNVDIAEGMVFSVADSQETRFCLMKEFKEPGIYEIKGSIATGTQTWTSANFAGFFYDMDDNIGSEDLTVESISNSRTIPEARLVYNTSIQQKQYSANFETENSLINSGTYPLIAFFGDEYVSLSDSHPDELVELLLDTSGSYTLRSGTALEMPNGYNLTAKQIDVGNDQVHMELSRNGKVIGEDVLSLANGGTTWTYKQAVGNTSDVIAFRALVTDVSMDSQGARVTVGGLYLADLQNVLSIQIDDEFVEFEVNSISDDTIHMSSTGQIYLARGEMIEIAPGIMFKVADDEALRYYPFVEKKLEENPLYLEIDSFSPSTEISSYEGSSQTFTLDINKPANFTWFHNGEQVQDNLAVDNASYTLSSPSFGDHIIKAVASNEKYSVVKEWKWTVQKSLVVVDKVEVMSSVYEGSSSIRIDPLDFSGFYYDLDKGIGSEEVSIKQITSRTIPEGGFVYNTSIQQMDYAANFASEPDNNNPSTSESYPVIGLFGEKYVPLSDANPDELVKLLVDNDDKYTLRTGSTLELPDGYELTAKQIDIEGNKVWMELFKDGEFVEDEVISVVGGPATWTYKEDAGTNEDVIVFRVHITDVFQGQVEGLTVIEGIYILDYKDVFYIESGDQFGELEVTSIGSGVLALENTGPIILNKDATINIAENILIKVADSDQLRFYLMKEYTDSGTYEIRGDVANSEAAWTPANFAGFFYDIDDDIGSEELALLSLSNRAIPEGYLVYSTMIQQKEYAANFGDDLSYPIIGLFGEKYVALSDNSVDKLVKLLVDSDDEHILRTDSVLELPNGYELTVKQIDVDNEKVWMELTKEGEFVEDEVINVVSGSATWTYNTDGIDVFKVLITDISADSKGSLITVGGIYLIDYQNILSIKPGDEFGKLQVDTVNGDTINMQSTGTIILGAGEIADIAAGMNFKVSDSDTLRYYPFVERKIEEAVPNIDPEANIISISPDPATDGESILFEGSGNDIDGNVVKYTWSSNIDGHLSNSASFSTDNLSIGVHTIYFKVQDSDGSWSDEVSANLTIKEISNQEPSAFIDSISPNPAKFGSSVELVGSGNDIDGSIVACEWTSSIDGYLGDSVTLNVSDLSIGDHTIYFRVQDDDGLWSDEVSANLTIIESVSNQRPSSRIVSISPNPAMEDELVYFAGEGSDNDGHIEGYNWTSSIDGYLKNSSSMNISTLSVGNHTIYFSVKDDDGSWSEPDTAYLRILDDSTPTDSAPEATIVSVLPNPAIQGECIEFKGFGKDTDGEVIGYNWRSSIDGHMTNLDNFSTAGLSAGNHTIYFKVQDDDGLWSDEVSANLTILNSTSYQKPSATIVSISPNPATEGECVSFEGAWNDTDSTVIGYNWRSSIDGHITTLVNFSTADLSVGTHTIYFKVQDDDGLWSNETVKTLTIKAKTSTVKASSSGGGGGSGSTTGEKYENILVKEVQSIFVNADSHINYKFKEDENAITSIQFDSLKNSGKIQTVIEVLKDRSSFAKIAAPGNVYQQMNIWVGKAGFVSPDNVKNLSIGFRVEKSWLEDNDIEANNIKMCRYADDSWSSLTTSVAGEDSDYVYFESQTTGFSPFAITAETDFIDSSNEGRSKSTIETDTRTDIDLEEPEKAAAEKSNLSSILLIFVGALVVSIGAYLMYRELR